MRTTLTIEDDLARRLKDEMRKTGLTFKQVVERYLRRGLQGGHAKKRFKVKARSLGTLPGLNYSKTSELLDRLDEEA